MYVGREITSLVWKIIFNVAQVFDDDHAETWTWCYVGKRSDEGN